MTYTQLYRYYLFWVQKILTALKYVYKNSLKTIFKLKNQTVLKNEIMVKGPYFPFVFKK